MAFGRVERNVAIRPWWVCGIQEGQAGPASTGQKAQSNSQVDWLPNVLCIFLARSKQARAKYVEQAQVYIFQFFCILCAIYAIAYVVLLASTVRVTIRSASSA